MNRLSLALAVSVFAVAPLGADGSTGSSAAVARPCTSNYVYRPVEMPLKVTGDLTVRLRNPYGSKVNIGREVGYFFVQFRIVYASAADRAKVAAVQWTLDGQPDKWRRVERGRDHAYLFNSNPLTEGKHVIGVTITPRSGSPVTGQIRFTATGCKPTKFAAEAEHRKQSGHQPFASWVDAGAPMRLVAIGSAGARISTRAALRGKKVGELRLAAHPNTPLALRLPRRWQDPHAITLLRRGTLSVVLDPSRRRFLTITGMPANTTQISLSFGGPRGFALLPSHAHGAEHAGTPGLIGTRRRCQRITWELWIAGTTGPTAHTTSRQLLARECRA